MTNTAPSTTLCTSTRLARARCALRQLALAGLGMVASVQAQTQTPAPSTGDTWFFVDLQGELHYATEQVDERYHRFSISPLPPGDGPLFVDVRAAASALAEATHTDPEAAARYFAESSGYQRHAGQLRAAADQHGVDEQLLKAIATAESGFNAQAVSPKGAIGLMQVIPDTALRFGVEGDKKRSLEQKLKDPAINVPLGARYLRHLQTLFPGRTDLVVAAYNAGEGAVQRYGNRIPPYQETQNYVKTVMTLYQSLQPRWGGDSVSTLCNMPAQQVCSVARSARLRTSLPARRGRTVR